MRRRDNGAPLREAMAQAGLSVRTLAAATKDLDPTGKGVSAATIGCARTAGATGRDSIGDDAAKLIAAALHKPVDSLFADDALFAASMSTISRRSRTREAAEAAGFECMVDTAVLAGVIRKSPTWVSEQPAAHPKGSATPFPIHYAGRSPRYFVSEVLQWMDDVRELETSAA